MLNVKLIFIPIPTYLYIDTITASNMHVIWFQFQKLYIYETDELTFPEIISSLELNPLLKFTSIVIKMLATVEFLKIIVRVKN